MPVSSKTKRLLLLPLSLIAFATWYGVIHRQPSNFLTVNFLDIGQGDAIFIEAPNHNQVLIDGGRGSAVLAELGEVMPFYDREIDLIISTHPDSDHLGGLIEVVKRYKVNKILTTSVNSDTKEFEEWERVIQEKNIPVQIAKAGQIITLSKNVKMEVVSPSEDYENKNVEDLNHTSIVNRLVFGDLEILFTGDAEEKRERELLLSGVNLDADILKVGHHGSKKSTTSEFIKAVSPEVAIIQVGENNRYNHPTKEVLERLAGITIYRNDKNGRIEVKSNGRGYKIKKEK